MRPAEVSRVINGETGIPSGPPVALSMMPSLSQCFLVLDSEQLKRGRHREGSEDELWILFFRATLLIRHRWSGEGRPMLRATGGSGSLSPFSDFRDSV